MIYWKLSLNYLMVKKKKKGGEDIKIYEGFNDLKAL